MTRPHMFWLTLFLTLAGPAAADDCREVAGLEALLQPSSVVLVGEMHGTHEMPAAVSEIVCQALAAKLQVTLALELPQDDQALLDTYLASAGTASDRAAFLTSPFWSSQNQDGRASVAMLRLIDDSRKRRQAGLDLEVVLLDRPQAMQQRDRVMADRLIEAVEAAPDRFFVALMGNLHNRVSQGSGRLGVFSAQALPTTVVTSLLATYSGGSAWICTEDGCGAHDLAGKPSDAMPRTVTLGSRSNHYDGTLFVGAITAASPAKEAPAAAGDELGPVDEGLLGVWLQVEPERDPAPRIEISRDFFALAIGDKLKYRAPILGEKDDVVVISIFCNRVDHYVEVDGNALTITMTPAKTKFRPDPGTMTARYVRQRERPEVFDLKPLPLGDPAAAMAAERLQELRADLSRRGEVDQEVRKPFSTPEGPTPEEQERMRDIDADNVKFLKGRVAEVGWIDADRFGKEASEAAWLIVQHSGDLALMKAVLPWIEKEVEATGENGSAYALLFDRSQIWLGEKQRYGSQIFYGPEGMFVAPLEDPENVDKRRAKLGMEPLADYKERFVERNGGKPLPVHTAF